MPKQTEIGAYETKTRLSAFLRKVQSGARFTITQRGHPVAELVPPGTSRKQGQADAAKRMRAFVHEQPPIREVDIKALIEHGRD